MDLAALIAAARKVNPQVVGVAIISHADDTQFVVIGVDRKSQLCDPRNWNYHPTPEAALADLAEQLKK